MNNTIDYQKKYLKYKFKYLELKKQYAGTSLIKSAAYSAAASLKSSAKNAAKNVLDSTKCLILKSEYKNNTQARSGCALETARQLDCTWTNNAVSVKNSSGITLGCRSCPSCNY